MFKDFVVYRYSQFALNCRFTFLLYPCNMLPRSFQRKVIVVSSSSKIRRIGTIHHELFDRVALSHSQKTFLKVFRKESAAIKEGRSEGV